MAPAIRPPNTITAGLDKSNALPWTVRRPCVSLYCLLDYQTAVVNPADDRTVRMISEYGDAATKAYKTVVSKVTP